MMKMGGTLRSQWTTVNGLQMHARVSARENRSGRPSIVLVHGLGVSSLYLVPLAEHFTPHFDVYAPDLPGFGRSERPEHVLSVPELTDALAAWMEANDLAGVPILGNSLGCQIIADLSARYPERISHAILVGPTADPNARSVPQLIWRAIQDIPHERLTLLLICVFDYLRAGTWRLFRTMRFLVQDPVEEKLRHVQIPALVLRGERDSIAPASWAQTVAHLLPRGYELTISGAAHAAHYSAPAAVARATRQFVQCAGHKERNLGEVAAREEQVS